VSAAAPDAPVRASCRRRDGARRRGARRLRRGVSLVAQRLGLLDLRRQRADALDGRFEVEKAAHFGRCLLAHGRASLFGGERRGSSQLLALAGRQALARRRERSLGSLDLARPLGDRLVFGGERGGPFGR
jgi:hypothetical protein